MNTTTTTTPYFIPFLNSHYFCICDTPLNCCYFTYQSYPFAHLTAFRRIIKFTTVYGSSVIQLPSAAIEPVRSLINTVFQSHRYMAMLYLLQYLYWNRLSTIKLFSKNRMHRVLELELEQTNNNCAMF